MIPDEHTDNSQHFIIREAKGDDLEAVWLLWKEIMDQKVFFPHDESCSRESIEKSWINQDNLIFVAENAAGNNQDKTRNFNIYDPGEIAGAYILKPNQPGYGKHIANASYMVSSSQRGKGLGKLLCAHSIGAGRKAQYRGIQFNLVVSTNIEAVKAWQANGFDIIGTVPGGFFHVEKGYVDAYIFFRDLTTT